MFSDIKTIIFDWDGTLHESMIIYKDAFQKAYDQLALKKIAPNRRFTDQEISVFLGVNPKDMWQRLIPHLSEDIFKEASQMVSDQMGIAISEGKARLYPNVIEVLTYLKNKGYQLIYLSNSKNYYMEAMKKTFELEKYFDMFVVAEMYDYIPKKNILQKIKSTLLEPMVMIGDRDIDIETGIFNKIKTIGCNYGYGSLDEFKNADRIINDIRDLMNIF